MFQTRDSLFSNCTSRGMERTYEAPSNEAPHMILGYHQGRLVTYLLHLCLWRPAKPRTGVSNFMFAASISFYFGSNRNHRSIFSTGTIARQFSQEIPVRLPQSASIFYSVLRQSVRTESHTGSVR